MQRGMRRGPVKPLHTARPLSCECGSCAWFYQEQWVEYDAPVEPFEARIYDRYLCPDCAEVEAKKYGRE